MQNKIYLNRQYFIFIGGENHGNLISPLEVGNLDLNKYKIMQKVIVDEGFYLKFPFIVGVDFDCDENHSSMIMLDLYFNHLFKQEKDKYIKNMIDKHIELMPSIK